MVPRLSLRIDVMRRIAPLLARAAGCPETHLNMVSGLTGISREIDREEPFRTTHLAERYDPAYVMACAQTDRDPGRATIME